MPGPSHNHVPPFPPLSPIDAQPTLTYLPRRHSSKKFATWLRSRHAPISGKICADAADSVIAGSAYRRHRRRAVRARPTTHPQVPGGRSGAQRKSGGGRRSAHPRLTCRESRPLHQFPLRHFHQLAPNPPRNANLHPLRRYLPDSPSQNARRRTLSAHFLPRQRHFRALPAKRRRLLLRFQQRHRRRRILSALPLRQRERQRHPAHRRKIAQHRRALVFERKIHRLFVHPPHRQRYRHLAHRTRAPRRSQNQSHPRPTQRRRLGRRRLVARRFATDRPGICFGQRIVSRG